MIHKTKKNVSRKDENGKTGKTGNNLSYSNSNSKTSKHYRQVKRKGNFRSRVLKGGQRNSIVGRQVGQREQSSKKLKAKPYMYSRKSSLNFPLKSGQGKFKRYSFANSLYRGEPSNLNRISENNEKIFEYENTNVIRTNTLPSAMKGKDKDKDKGPQRGKLVKRESQVFNNKITFTTAAQRKVNATRSRMEPGTRYTRNNTGYSSKDYIGRGYNSFHNNELTTSQPGNPSSVYLVDNKGNPSPVYLLDSKAEAIRSNLPKNKLAKQNYNRLVAATRRHALDMNEPQKRSKGKDPESIYRKQKQTKEKQTLLAWLQSLFSRGPKSAEPNKPVEQTDTNWQQSNPLFNNTNTNSPHLGISSESVVDIYNDSAGN